MISDIANHLWQSTAFAVAAGLLTTAFRKNQARVRYWLWFSASLKFFVPFALLITVGQQLEWPRAAQKIATPAVAIALTQVSRPFAGTSPSTVLSAPMPRTAVQRGGIALTALWLFGMAALALMRLNAWRRIRAMLRASTSWEPGLKIPPNVRVRAAQALMEPCVVGWWRPVLLVPAGIERQLTSRQLEAVLAHELCHFRRRDNLTAAIHIVAEAVFWFHPLVWWIGARLVEERERACDEEVLRVMGEPSAYAEGILKICKRYAEAPLVCVAGVSGADLRKRLEAIMTNRVGVELNLVRRLALGGAAVAALTLPVITGAIDAQSPPTPQAAFEVVSVKPYKVSNSGRGGDLRDPAFLPGGRFTSRAPLIMVIAAAYNVPFFGPTARISGGPGWIDSPDAVYEIEATPAKDSAVGQRSASAQAQARRQMLRALLADRFKLVVRSQIKEMPVYVLTVGKDGPKLPRADIRESDCPETPPADSPGDGTKVCHRFNGGRGRGLHGRAVDMSDLVDFVQGWTDRPLFDETGLSGLYHIDTEPWAPLELGPSRANADGVDVANLPTLFTVFERLGLKMIAQKRNVETYVIEHVEKPTQN